jgi:DNA-binding GntR family transcriptional regulator
MSVQSIPRSRGTRPLRTRLVEELRERISAGALAPGMALPSVRSLARERGVSAFTAAEVYNVLTAAGLVEARRGSGYFVAGTRVRPPAAPAAAAADALWERRLEARAQPILVDAGGG